MTLKFKHDIDLDGNNLLNPGTVGGLANLSDVDLTGIEVGDTLLWDGDSLIPGVGSGDGIFRPSGWSVEIVDDLPNGVFLKVTAANQTTYRVELSPYLETELIESFEDWEF